MKRQPSTVYFTGLDLGPLAEFSALAVVERPFVPPNAAHSQLRPVHSLRHLQRFPPGTPYLEIVAEARKLFCHSEMWGSVLILDKTGVGKMVSDWIADQLQGTITATFIPINISAGPELTQSENGTFLIPKKELAGTLQVLLQTRRLSVARALPDAPMLAKEMENFKVKKITLQENTLEAWREGQHDDLVLAVALAAYVSESTLPKWANDVYEPVARPTVMVPW